MSRYLDWLHRDEAPEEKKELTRREKISNWWDYHFWHVVIAAGILLAVGRLLWSMLGIGTIKPDFQAAYVGTDALPVDTVTALEAALASLGSDLNGDGQTVIRLHQYVLPSSDPQTMAYGYAAEGALLSDLESCDSYFFLLEDPEGFQARYFSLARLDGSLPAEGDTSADGTWLRFGDCPVLSSLELGRFSEASPESVMEGDNQEQLKDLAIARRGFLPNGKTVKYKEGCDALWEYLTDGAPSWEEAQQGGRSTQEETQQ